jgi:hypothetical protein
MGFIRSNMLYDDGKYYTWTAKSSDDDPKTVGGKEKDELNRKEGYEVLPFIQNWVATYFRLPSVVVYQKVEKMIRYHVPSGIRKQEEIAKWIYENYNSIRA